MSSLDPEVSFSSLSLTHVLYDSSSYVAYGLAYLTLSPILIMATYAWTVVSTRELTLAVMFLGQLLNEAFNYCLKVAFREERPIVKHGDGYGFPSSHSQFMGYFSAFILLHLSFRHRYPQTGFGPSVDYLQRATLYFLVLLWAGLVCYSRHYLSYHTPFQVVSGYGIGILFAIVYYSITELIPIIRPQSNNERLRVWFLDLPICRWFRIRDSWEVWGDGGGEGQWLKWRTAYDKKIVLTGAPSKTDNRKRR